MYANPAGCDVRSASISYLPSGLCSTAMPRSFFMASNATRHSTHSLPRSPARPWGPSPCGSSDRDLFASAAARLHVDQNLVPRPCRAARSATAARWPSVAAPRRPRAASPPRSAARRSRDRAMLPAAASLPRRGGRLPQRLAIRRVCCSAVQARLRDPPRFSGQSACAFWTLRRHRREIESRGAPGNRAPSASSPSAAASSARPNGPRPSGSPSRG